MRRFAEALLMLELGRARRIRRRDGLHRGVRHTVAALEHDATEEPLDERGDEVGDNLGHVNSPLSPRRRPEVKWRRSARYCGADGGHLVYFWQPSRSLLPCY